MTEKDKAQLRQLLVKEANGRLSPQEQATLDEWYNTFDVTHQDITVFKDATHEELVKQRLLNRILEIGFAELPTTKASNKRRLIQWFAAAALLLMFACAALIWRFVDKAHKQNEVLLSAATGIGKIQKIVLEDGTIIWLNAGSVLKYPTHFADHSREVYLQGEAYFDVAHDKLRPFAVHTDKLVTHVLGTAFSVTAYKNMPTEIVTVVRGKVGVSDDHKLLGFLTPDKKMEYNINNGKSSFTDVVSAGAVSWKEGKLAFDNQDIRDITGRLSRWYGYTINFEHSKIKNCRYTASFDNQIPLNKLLKVMKAISLVNYRIDTAQKTVTFLGTGCNQ